MRNESSFIYVFESLNKGPLLNFDDNKNVFTFIALTLLRIEEFLRLQI